MRGDVAFYKSLISKTKQKIGEEIKFSTQVGADHHKESKSEDVSVLEGSIFYQRRDRVSPTSSRHTLCATSGLVPARTITPPWLGVNKIRPSSEVSCRLSQTHCKGFAIVPTCDAHIASKTSICRLEWPWKCPVRAGSQPTMSSIALFIMLNESSFRVAIAV